MWRFRRSLEPSTDTGRLHAARRLSPLLLSGLLIHLGPPAAALGQTPQIVRSVPADPFAAFVAEAAQRFGVPESWIRAVMRVESAGEARAISQAGAMGLMQIMPGTWADLRARHRLGSDPYDPRDNILAGAAYLREMHDRYGSPGFLAAYNAGPGRYDEYLASGRALPAETRAYVAALAPVVGSGEIAGPITVAAADPFAWTRAPLFIAHSGNTTASDPAQTESRSSEAPSPPPVREASAAAPQSSSLFVARSDRGGPP